MQGKMFLPYCVTLWDTVGWEAWMKKKKACLLTTQGDRSQGLHYRQAMKKALGSHSERFVPDVLPGFAVLGVPLPCVSYCLLFFPLPIGELALWAVPGS